MVSTEKIPFHKEEVQAADNQTLDSWLQMNPKLFAFALDQYLNREFRTWGEVFPQYAKDGLRLQARVQLLADLPHNLDSDGV